MIGKRTALLLIVIVAVGAASACGASGPLAGGPGPLPNRVGPISNNQGNQDFSDESYEDALEAYERAAQELPDSPEPPYNSGNTQYRQENFEEARGQYQEAEPLVLAPNAADRARIVPGPKEEAPEADACARAEPTPAQRRHRLAWADLLRRVFRIDVTVCPPAVVT